MATLETAILAGGCFWGMEDLIRKQPGILDTVVGYTGGTLENPSYRDVRTGQTAHAESIKIDFDNDIVSYRQILEFFFQIHDPTTTDRQGNDRGSQYRSAIFYMSEEQHRTAVEVIDAVNASGKWPGPVVTEIEPAGPFWPAEKEHQDYLENHPEGYTCHFVRPEWTL